MSTNQVLEQVRTALTEADDAGRPRPGRPTLTKLTGATDHQVRKALAELAAAEAPAFQAGNSLASDASTEPIEAAIEPAAEPARDRRLPRPWPLAIIGLAAAVAVWGGWVRLGELTGFGPVNVLPGIGGGFVLDTAVVLPVSVEAYAAYALHVLLASAGMSERTRVFAKRSFFTSLAVGGGAQVASHVMGAAGVTAAPWWVTTLVACVPVLVVGLATGLATLVRQDATAGDEGGDGRS
ncbi:hypothetical protein [Kutzneria sp. CA-103260]|uniref:hypothetical protein n=1 Tax=Kutzneria sp. CA-103260 TaxID=2802641 RepID=UPI001BACD66F|nr:hypothetical protein [Kutzneria sp. CA-103260]QUQ72549.1 hypothetical protein JJ691_103380 [Kutzneria sp. CA-103260]